MEIASPPGSEDSRAATVRIGLLGCGNIGRIVVKQGVGVYITAVFDKDPTRVKQLARESGANAHEKFQSFIEDDFDILLEAASVQAVYDYARWALIQGKDLIILSVGAFADLPFRQNLQRLAIANGRHIRIPSGALFGLDNLKIGQISCFDKLTLRTTKNPASFSGEIGKRTLLFHGTARDCIERFPRNVNVAVALSLAAGKEVDVELWADPDCKKNTHEVIVAGEFGEASILVKNVPSPDNPATSYLAALSVLTLLKNLSSPFIIGT